MKRLLTKLTLRICACALIALPLTRLLDHPRFLEPEFAMLLDTSESMRGRFPALHESALEKWRQLDRVNSHVLQFDDYPRAYAEGRSQVPTIFTDLASALRAGMDLFSRASEKRLLLVTDGLTRMAGLQDATHELRRRGIRVFALNLPEPERKAGIENLVMPSRAFLWEPFTVKAMIRASSPGLVRAVLKKNGYPIRDVEIPVDAAGFGQADFIQESDRVGTVFFTLHLPEFNALPAHGSVRIATAPKVRYISDDPPLARRLIDIIRGAGIEVNLSTPSDLVYFPLETDDDVIIIDDLPAPALHESVLARLQKAVASEGRGLLLLGGRRGLGTEGYRESSLEPMLPVTAGYSSPPDPPPVSMVLAMDTSFSMYFRGPGKEILRGGEPRKIDVARESAREVVRLTRPEDRFGMIGNSDDLYWIRRLGPARDREDILAKIDGIKARGGGLDFYSILNESYRSLKEETGPIRHLLVLCDAEDIDQQMIEGIGHSFDLIRKMSGMGITLSILAIGQPGDKDVSFLRTAALLGRGDFYLVSDLRTLPRYSVSEYRKLTARHFIEEEVLPVPGEFSRIMHGITGPLPPLSGMALVTPRRGSETPIRTDFGAPLLTIGRYGGGRTAVFSSDSGFRWASRWLDWSAAERFWLQLLFLLSPRAEETRGESFALSADYYRDRFVFRHRTARGTFPAWQRIRLRTMGEPEEELDFVRTGLTEYLSPAPLSEPGFYRYKVFGVDGKNETAVTEVSLDVPSPPEMAPSPDNLPLLNEILRVTGGEWVSTPVEITRNMKYFRIESGTLAIFALAAGLIVLLVETALTRYFWR